jgi:hypothetical protein
MKLLFIFKISLKNEMPNGIEQVKTKLEIEMLKVEDKRYKNMLEESKKKEMN